jgi:transcriptional regulator with XRE-family HTH domain
MDAERIGRAIRTLRQKAGYTQKELAEKLFISDVAVSKWERGKSVPDTATLMKLSELLDMDVDGLLDGTASYLGDRWLGALLLDGAALRADTPLFDKPLIDYLLSYFLLAGVREALIACGEKERDYIDGRFRGGEALGIRLRFTSPEALTAEAALGCFRQGEGDLMLVTEPFFLYGVDLTRFLQRAMQRKSPAVNLASVVGQGGTPLREGFSHYAYRPLPLFFLQSRFLAACPSRTPLRELPRLAEEGKRLRSEPMDKGFLCAPLRSKENARTVSALVHVIQQLGNYLIYCPPEIAWRRGMLRGEELLRAAEAFPEYGEYLRSLV